MCVEVSHVLCCVRHYQITQISLQACVLYSTWVWNTLKCILHFFLLAVKLILVSARRLSFRIPPPGGAQGSQIDVSWVWKVKGRVPCPLSRVLLDLWDIQHINEVYTPVTAIWAFIPLSVSVEPWLDQCFYRNNHNQDVSQEQNRTNMSLASQNQQSCMTNSWSFLATSHISCVRQMLLRTNVCFHSCCLRKICDHMYSKDNPTNYSAWLRHAIWRVVASQNSHPDNISSFLWARILSLWAAN